MSDTSGALPLFHGTRAGFRKGGLLLPGDMVGKDNHALGRSDWVYVTTSVGLAQRYADVSQGRGRPKVLEVAPLGKIEVDDSTVLGAEQPSFRCDAARVVRVLPR